MINIISKKMISGNKVMAEMFVDDLEEILDVTSVDGYELFQGSIAYEIKSGELFVMGEDSLWYSSDEETTVKNFEKRISALEAKTVVKPVYSTQSEFDSLAQTDSETTYFIVEE